MQASRKPAGNRQAETDELFGAAVETLDGTQFAAGARNRNVDAVPAAGEVIIYRPDPLFADGFD